MVQIKFHITSVTSAPLAVIVSTAQPWDKGGTKLVEIAGDEPWAARGCKITAVRKFQCNLT